MLMVEEGAMLSEDRVDEAFGEVVKCFPACTRRRSDGGTEVRSARSCLRVVMVVEEGMLRGIAGDRLASVLKTDKGRGLVLSPERSLTKIWYDSAGSNIECVEALEEDREVRMMARRFWLLLSRE